MIGKTLAQYEITGLLGSGGMGDVWRARDTKLGRDVALKLLPDDVASDPERRTRFEREARAIAALTHPNVVTIYAVEEAEGHVLLSMEVIEGRTLGEMIPENGMTLDQVLSIAEPLAGALAAAHARGITHRDLKPANVMVTNDGHVKVLDFGLAKLIEDDPVDADATIAVDATAEGRVLGTTAYMSPEQAEGKPVDPRSDVFALGILLYQMATGEKPFVGDTPISTITSILRDEPRPMAEIKPELPSQIGRIIGRCLQKNPDNRYDTAKGLVFDLESLREDSSTTSIASPVPAASSRNRNLVLGAAVLVILVSALALLRGGGGDASDDPVEADVVSTTATPMLVVFPFENRGEATDAYFADGITDEIATRLVGTDGIAVISRSSARSYDRAGKSIPEIGADLGVDYVLEGSIRWQKDADGASVVRVSPVLVDARNDRQVWAQSYDRDMSEIFAIQTEIAAAVATQIGTALAPNSFGDRADAPTTDVEAYHLFLRAQQYVDRGQLRAEEWAIAETLLMNALDRDRTYAAAWAYLARVHAGFRHFNWDPTEARLAAARRAAARVRELAPGSLKDHQAHGYVAYWGEKDFATATREFEAALAMRPGDVETIEALAFVARREGRFEDALAWLRRAQDVSPSNWRLAFNQAETLHVLRRYEEALQAADNAIRFDPGATGGYIQRAMTLANTGRLRAAIDVVQDVPSDSRLADAIAVDLGLAALDLEAAREAVERLPDYATEQFSDISGLLGLAFVNWAEQGPEAARPPLGLAIEVLRAVVEENPDASNPASLLALALAAAGQDEPAIALGRAALDRYPANKDQWIRLSREWDLVRVLLLCGHTDEAETLLRRLCNGPSTDVSREFLRAAPLFRENSPIEPYRAVAAFEL